MPSGNIKSTPLYTIGYTGFSEAEGMASYLKTQKVDVLIDVRSSPYSSHFPQFNKENLQRVLKNSNIYYRNYAISFGARQENHTFYRNGRLDFELYTKSEQFIDGLAKVQNSVEKGYVLALMCAEKDPLICHRAIMISRILHEDGYSIRHLRPDREEETHEDLEKRLVELYFPETNQLDLFSEPMSFEDKLKESYRLQNDIIGFQEGNL